MAAAATGMEPTQAGADMPDTSAIPLAQLPGVRAVFAQTAGEFMDYMAAEAVT